MSGFYAVLDRDDPDLAEQLVSCASVLQVRLKNAAAIDVLAAARRAREITRRAGALLIINDRVDIALAADADGVHLGQDDLPLEAARRIAPHLIIGISTHNLAQVQGALHLGARHPGARHPGARHLYLGYGPVFETRTKVNPDPVQGIQALRAAVEAAEGVPVVAIGGITPENVTAVAAAGAAAACAISSVNGAPDVVRAGRAIAAPWLNIRSLGPS